jgi:hypothetical protein
MHAKYRSENLMWSEYFENIGVDGILLDWILRKQRVWNGFIWLKKGASGGLL